MTLPMRELTEETPAELLAHYQRVRSETEWLADSLSAEDMQLQSMPDASPGKWHLAHTSWFFEIFILRRFLPGYRPFDPTFHQLFNSYYNSLGNPFSRAQRGLLSRPSLDRVLAYRRAVDEAMQALEWEVDFDEVIAGTLILGLNHEQQHQELLLTDIKHAFSINPAQPAYIESAGEEEQETREVSLSWLPVGEGIYTIGSDGEHFHFDNEGPCHRQQLTDFRIASRLVSNGEYREFIEDGGYRDPRLWLSDGWQWVQQQRAMAPIYWRCGEGEWSQFTLCGPQPLIPSEPVCHVNFYEAEAFARWAGARLPTEFEWEVAAWMYRKPDQLAQANLLGKRQFRPLAPEPGQLQFLGDLWEWTGSAYLPYPGFKASTDAVGEYNGKFMCNQMVLRGGSCVTPTDHIRISYRNFFHPHQYWQFSGIRLAGDVI